MADLIYQYTSGYPYLVSKFCKIMDEEAAGSIEFPVGKKAWTYAGFLEAKRGYFITCSCLLQRTKGALRDKNQFIYAGNLDMDLLLKRFVMHFDDLYGDCSDRFKEEGGKQYFLLYLRPIINGTGNYYIESRTRNMERTDVIVDYRGEQMVIVLKIWRGNAYNERGEEQLVVYLDHYHLKKGYMLSYDLTRILWSSISFPIAPSG